MTGNKRTAIARLPDGTEVEVSDVSLEIRNKSVDEIDTDELLANNIKVQGSITLGAIHTAYRDAFRALTGEARRNAAPHKFRPDLRGSGMPRKRGKGKR